jgi:hypothetical protein
MALPDQDQHRSPTPLDLFRKKAFTRRIKRRALAHTLPRTGLSKATGATDPRATDPGLALPPPPAIFAA